VDEMIYLVHFFHITSHRYYVIIVSISTYSSLLLKKKKTALQLEKEEKKILFKNYSFNAIFGSLK